MNDPPSARAILAEASRTAGLDTTSVQLLRDGENTIYRLPHGVIARISRPGQQQAARREVEVSRWLNASGVVTVAALDIPEQPIDVSGRAVTFWQELPAHRQGTPYEVARTLKRLHGLEVPRNVALGCLDPFVRLDQRINSACIPDDDRAWLTEQTTRLHAKWSALAPSLGTCIVHGDAWAGNVVTTVEGRTVLLDLERCSVGPPEWDLTSTAVKYTTYGGISRAEYDDFAETYGRDVIAWGHFELLRSIRELRMTCYVAQHAARDARSEREAALRIECLRGKHGTRPWPWTPAE
jgi:Ser/Thr protein kinase RdoA (MazF antagonist)